MIKMQYMYLRIFCSNYSKNKFCLFSGCIIPQRYILGVMGLLGVCNAYTMRVCLNLAITQMVNRTKAAGDHYVDPDACPSDDIVTNTTTNTNRPVSERNYLLNIFLEFFDIRNSFTACC